MNIELLLAKLTQKAQTEGFDACAYPQNLAVALIELETKTLESNFSGYLASSSEESIAIAFVALMEINCWNSTVYLDKAEKLFNQGKAVDKLSEETIAKIDDLGKKYLERSDNFEEHFRNWLQLNIEDLMQGLDI